MAKNKVILSIIIVFTIAVVIYIFLAGSDKKAVKETVDSYINAVRDKNFDTIYNLNAASQRRMLFALKGSDANKNELLKQEYNEQKALFDSAKANVFEINSSWSEKSIFVQDMNYRIANVAMEQDIDNPTSFYRKRINASVLVEVEYNKKDTAPLYEGKNIKKANLLVSMIHIKNIAKAIKARGVAEDKWLFKGIAIKDGSIVYW